MCCIVQVLLYDCTLIHFSIVNTVIGNLHLVIQLGELGSPYLSLGYCPPVGFLELNFIPINLGLVLSVCQLRRCTICFLPENLYFLLLFLFHCVINNNQSCEM